MKTITAHNGHVAGHIDSRTFRVVLLREFTKIPACGEIQYSSFIPQKFPKRLRRLWMIAQLRFVQEAACETRNIPQPGIHLPLSSVPHQASHRVRELEISLTTAAYRPRRVVSRISLISTQKERNRHPQFCHSFPQWINIGTCAPTHFQVRYFDRLQGRSSVVEQWPFKPKVVGSIPTAPTSPSP